MPEPPAPVLHRAAGPVTVVGGGPFDPLDLVEALAVAPEAVGADSGGDTLLPAGARFRAVIGDLDSQTTAARRAAEGVAVHRIAEQDTTDLEKCLAAVEAPLYVGVGFLGGRVDHELAALSALLRFGHQKIVLIGREDVVFACPAELRLDLAAATRVSLFPMAPITGIVSEGLRWPVTGLRLAPGDRIGTSNRALGGPVRVVFDAPGALVILPREALPQALDALAVSPPVR